MKEGEKLNKKLVLITNDVIEECLCESLDILEKNTSSYRKNKKTLK
jgi:hypothetical protein